MTFDEAREEAATWARWRWDDRPDDRLVLIWDPAARLRIVVKFAPKTHHKDDLRNKINDELAAALGAFFSGDVLVHDKTTKTTGLDHVFETAWNLGKDLPETRGSTRLLDRRRTKETWYEPVTPPWPVPGGPPIVTFASYKGGFGRSTALAATAVGFAQEGLRLLVIDLDLEAPGLWSLLPPQHAGQATPSPEAGLVDVLLGTITAISSVYPAEATTGIDVLAAGSVDAGYLEKLARIDYEGLVTTSNDGGPLPNALRALREHGEYDLILLDARAGLHDLTGAAVNGLPHLVVLFGRDTEESWAGIELMLRQIGADRIGSSGGQQDILLVYAKAPGDTTNSGDPIFDPALRSFRDQAYNRMDRSYYASPEDVASDGDDITLPDEATPKTQHDPIGLLFDRDTLHGDGKTVPADRLGYGALRDRIRERVGLLR